MTTKESPAAVAPTTASLGVRITKQIEELRAPFVSYAQGFSAISSRSSDLAPRFINAFEKWKTKTNGSFVSFVRIFDASISEDVDEYKKHPTYNAANYLRRIYYDDVKGVDTRGGHARAGGGTKAPKVDEIIASAMAAVIPLISADNIDAAWRQVQGNLEFSDNRIEKIKELVPKTEPLFKVRIPRGVQVRHALKIAA